MSSVAGPIDNIATLRSSRRQFLRGALAAGVSASAAGPLLSSCGDDDSGASADGQGGDSLRIGVASYIPNVIDFDKIVEEFRASAPDLTVSVTPIDVQITNAQEFVQKVILEARQGEASYDLFFGAPWWAIGSLAEANVLTPFSEVVASDVLDDLLDSVRQGATIDDEIYSLPVWADVNGLIYRSDLLEEHAGTTEPPATWDQLVSVVQQLQQNLPADTYAYGADWNVLHRFFLTIFVTLTDQPYTDDGLVNLADPAALEALELVRTLHAFMPPNASDDLGSSETFQAGKVVMETYWQAQRTRAVTAGLDENVVKMAANPRGDRDSTVFWTTDIMIPTNASNKEAAGQFCVDGFLNNAEALQASADSAAKIIPFRSALEQVSLPEFMQPSAEQIANGTPIPLNAAYLGFEQPAFKEQAERMILQGQSPKETIENLQAAFVEGATQ